MRILVTVLAGVTGLAPLYAHAQGFNAQTFRPSNSTSGAFSQDAAHVLQRNDVDVGLTLDYAHNSLVLRDPDSGAILPGGGVLSNRLVGHLGAGVGVGGFVELRARLPVIPFENGNVSTLRAGEALNTATIGDLSLGAKAALYGKRGREGLQLALAADLDLPTGSAANFAGDDAFSFRPRLVVGFEQQGFFAALNGGYAVRRQRAIPVGRDPAALVGAGRGVFLPRLQWGGRCP